jgi:hypothetical protein
MVVVYKCQVLNQCFIVYNGPGGTGTYIWGVTVPYFVIDGFDIDGGESSVYGGLANICVASSLNDTGKVSHHEWVLNNNIHGCGLGCVLMADSEYYYMLHNNMSDCAWTSVFQGSGLCLCALKALGDNLNPYPPYTPTPTDLNTAPFHNMVSWNRVFNNGCTTCNGTVATFTTTGNTHSSTTLDGLASRGTSASFTGSIAAGGITLTVTGISGTISRASFPRGWTVPIDPARAASGSRSAIPPASRCSGSGARGGIGDPGTFWRSAHK